ncbi:NAD(P)-dependent oxidoreductase [Pseudomonas floridensis]|uniref:NAD(P)-dependent oxidoreductase n=1 Tax=Pseudomonas floridensis TaxID=1958950 RepID=A0A1X0N4Q2_9PSED|nr:SDR family oxidoreductase [Pseudomonas floridensis]ORC57846.1 NAD(P)-dependent oxidoreductase [Pseudomonas floridensis]
MPAPTVLIAGCGDIGSRLATRLLAHEWSVYGLRRTISGLSQGIVAVEGDLFQAEKPAGWPTGPIDYLVYCATPSQRDEIGYRKAYVDGLRHVLGWLNEQGQRPRRVFFVSSSGVYGQQNGEWVDETSVTEPVGFSGTIMLEAEHLARDSGFPATAVRLTGIYGPGRADLSNRVRQGHSVRVDPPVYANRIHADDAAGLLAHLLEADERGVALDDCYLGVDDDPAALADVVSWIREYLGVTEWSEDVSVQRVGSKRCSNARAKALGWTPVYPDYRAGYAALLG